MQQQNIIELQDIVVEFDGERVLDKLNLSIRDGEFVTLLGASGCGKTTTLRVIAGFVEPQSGQVLFNSKKVNGVPPNLRPVNTIFQRYALFPHLNVFENIAFGLRAKPRAQRPSEAQIREKVEKLLELIQLEWIAKRLPSELSGGQRQRVALARVLAVDPSVLLLDEPFGALDAKVRQELRHWLRERHADLGVTTIFVTHDQEEAMEVSDRIVLIHDGKIEQTGSPDDLYNHPVNPFVCDFLGLVNMLPLHGKTLYLRPHEIALESAPLPETCPATITAIRTAGPMVQLELRADGHPVTVAMTHEQFAKGDFAIGKTAHLRPLLEREFG
jgi:sulfate transport system ATP-binding protein